MSRNIPALLLCIALAPVLTHASTPTGASKPKSAVKRTAPAKPAVAVKTPDATPVPSPATTPVAGAKAAPKKGGKAEAKPTPEANVVLKALKGKVEMKAPGRDKWTTLREGDSVPAGATLRSGEGARALVVFPNKSVVWLKEKTTLEVAERVSLMTRLRLLAGSVKIKVPHLKRKEKFEVESGGVVCGVRGTVLTMDKPVEAKKPAVDVLFGEVRVNVPDGNGAADKFRSIMVTQGKGWMDGKLSLLSPERERLGIEDWTPGIPEEARLAAIREDVARRLAMRQHAVQAVAREESLAAAWSTQKEEDFAAGRTMTDVHGNLVRIDQRFARPELDTWEVINLVKRTNYNFRQRNFAYNGPRGARLDILRSQFEFNMPMPQTLNDIPAFVERIDELKVDRITLVTGNVQEGRIFTVGLFGERPSLSVPGATDEIDMGLYAGTLETDAAKSAALKWLGLSMSKPVSSAMFWNVNGLAQFMEPAGPDIPKPEWDGAEGEFYHGEAKKWAEVVYSGIPSSPASYTGNVMWMCNESYFINSKGEVWTIDKLLTGDITLRTFLDDMAFETIYYTKADSGPAGPATLRPSQTVDADFGYVVAPDNLMNTTGAPVTQAFNAHGDNIDLIFTPDLLVAIVKSLLNAATDVKDDTKD
jgi:hypothetical protein